MLIVHEKKGVTHAFSIHTGQFHLVINQSGCEPKKLEKIMLLIKSTLLHEIFATCLFRDFDVHIFRDT